MTRSVWPGSMSSSVSVTNWLNTSSHVTAWLIQFYLMNDWMMWVRDLLKENFRWRICDKLGRIEWNFRKFWCIHESSMTHAWCNHDTHEATINCKALMFTKERWEKTSFIIDTIKIFSQIYATIKQLHLPAKPRQAYCKKEKV